PAKWRTSGLRSAVLVVTVSIVTTMGAVMSSCERYAETALVLIFICVFLSGSELVAGEIPTVRYDYAAGTASTIGGAAVTIAGADSVAGSATAAARFRRVAAARLSVIRVGNFCPRRIVATVMASSLTEKLTL